MDCSYRMTFIFTYSLEIKLETVNILHYFPLKNKSNYVICSKDVIRSFHFLLTFCYPFHGDVGLDSRDRVFAVFNRDGIHSGLTW
jgi:hypothetical protein